MDLVLMLVSSPRWSPTRASLPPSLGGRSYRDIATLASLSLHFSYVSDVSLHALPLNALRLQLRIHVLHPWKPSYHATRRTTALFLKTTGPRGPPFILSRPHDRVLLPQRRKDAKEHGLCDQDFLPGIKFPDFASLRLGGKHLKAATPSGGSRGRSPSRLCSLS